MMAADKKARGRGELEAGRKAYNSLHNKNIAKIYGLVKKQAQRWDMSREDFERAACGYAFACRSDAPRNVQLLFTGRPAFYSQEAKTLASAFFIIFSDAFGRLRAIDGGIGYQTETWKAANERYEALCKDPNSDEVSRFWAAYDRLLAYEEHTKPDAAKCWKAALSLVGGAYVE